jgi:KEOPS complex subunit Pcc1
MFLRVSSPFFHTNIFPRFPQRYLSAMPHVPAMPHEAVFRITSDHAPAIVQAIAPELADEVNPRSVTACSLEGCTTLVIRVSAMDTAALRAALNMVLRLVNVADEVQELV